MDTQSAEWYDVIGKFKANAAQFMASYNALMNAEGVARKNPALYQEWQALRSKADGVKAKIKSVTGAVDSAAAWIKDKFGLNGLGETLGILPALVPIAVVVTSVAAMTYVISDISKFLIKAKQFETVAAQVGPEKAAQVVSQMNQESGVISSIGSSAKSVAILVAIAAGVYYLPKLLNKK